MARETQTINDKILSYGDNLLRRSDIELLQGPCWLNDQIISFYFDYLCMERFYEEHDNLLFVGGAMTFLLKELAGQLHGAANFPFSRIAHAVCNCTGTDDIASIVAPMKLTSRELVLFAVNNNPDCSVAEGGSHWTLLVYSRKDSRFSHYDSSLGSSNLLVAKQIAGALRPYLDHPAKDCQVHAAATPAQTNAFDCGVYVLACAELIVEQWTQKCSENATDFAMEQQLTPGVIASTRSQILSLIQAKAGDI